MAEWPKLKAWRAESGGGFWGPTSYRAWVLPSELWGKAIAAKRFDA